MIEASRLNHTVICSLVNCFILLLNYPFPFLLDINCDSLCSSGVIINNF